MYYTIASTRDYNMCSDCPVHEIEWWEGYPDTAPEGWPSVARFIWDVFTAEKLRHDLAYKAGRVSAQTLFIDWCAGLPSVLDTCYYYNRSAVDDLGALLEESESEKARYTETAAEEMLTRLIYRELWREVSK